jgi:predicted metal-dependent hydrolase
MKGEFKEDFKIDWKINAAARRIRISVKPGGQVVVTRPKRVPLFVAQLFVKRKTDWLLRSVAKMRKVKAPLSHAQSRKDFASKKKDALAFVVHRLPEMNRQYGFVYKKVSIRNQKTRWGSCSKTGTLSFNYRILDLPAPLADYLLVHELCHLQEMNHSKKFWALVGRAVPEYKKSRALLHAAKSPN